MRRGPIDDWYRDAVIYEVHVRAFADSDGDGIGDFRGLVGKLDHLERLGATALWLLPFYPSPLRDDGYDISDYTAVHPAYGTLDDVRLLLEEAHRRDVRVLVELVLNHTSDRHPWFRRARMAVPGTPERDFYVWSGSPDRYAGARVIFRDFEASNWTWDPVAGAYYWHRFFRHQPDLNYDNPEVRRAILGVVDFWLELGVDGLRLDAVPFLFEREGTSCENLPQTHAFLRELRTHVDERFPGRVLLAEANQQPEDATAYFGCGDEAHMAFHFPLMPRLFMAAAMADRGPVVDVLSRTLPIPEGCRWALFLRNHDELTLEMVSEEDRELLYRAYAPDPGSRLNLGIRHRLAPLLGGREPLIELLYGLLLSLPGTPVLYYGDEIGMGDDPTLPDRDGLRTPMPWTAGPGARSSTAPGHLRPTGTGRYGRDAVNVRSQEADPRSLLNRIRRLLAGRRSSPALARGSTTLLEPDDRSVLAFVREHEDQRVLVVANLAATASEVHLDLGPFRDLVPRLVLEDVELGPISDPPYRLSLGPYGLMWLCLEAGRGAVPLAEEAPSLEVAG